MIIESPVDLIFRELFYRLRAFAGCHDVFLKLEGFNVTGSIKIKTALGLLEDLEKRGIAKPGKTAIVESSSGNLGLALSLLCAVKHYKFICVTDPNANHATVREMELHERNLCSAKVAVDGYKERCEELIEGRNLNIDHERKRQIFEFLDMLARKGVFDTTKLTCTPLAWAETDPTAVYRVNIR